MDATFNYLKCPVFNNNKQHETHKETESVAFTLLGGGGKQTKLFWGISDVELRKSLISYYKMFK